MKKSILTTLIAATLLALIQSCDDSEHPDIKEKNTIFHQVFNPALTIDFDETFETDTLTLNLDNDTLMPAIDVCFYKEDYNRCSEFIKDTYYVLYFDFKNGALTTWDNGGAPGTPFPLDTSYVVDENDNFNPSATFYVKYDCLNWHVNITNIDSMHLRHYGLRLQKKDSVYYGWMKMELENNTIQILEYAYQTNTNEQIKVGQW